MKKIDTVIFDLGGVLIDWNPNYLYRNIFNDEKQMNDFFAEICTSDWNEQQDGGRSLREATEELVARYPGHENNIRAYYDRWEEMLKGPIEETVEILKELKQKGGIKLYALTNWSAETFPVALDRFEFLHWFDGRPVSGEERIRKPYKEIYQLLMDRYNINASSALYIDDNERNLSEPKKLGMDTIHFFNPGDLRKELTARGLL